MYAKEDARTHSSEDFFGKGFRNNSEDNVGKYSQSSKFHPFIVPYICVACTERLNEYVKHSKVAATIAAQRKANLLCRSSQRNQGLVLEKSMLQLQCESPKRIKQNQLLISLMFL